MKSTAAQIKRTINGTLWTAILLGGTVSLSAEVLLDDAARMLPALALATEIGLTVDVFADYSEPGFTMVTVQASADRIEQTMATIARLGATGGDCGVTGNGGASRGG